MRSERFAAKAFRNCSLRSRLGPVTNTQSIFQRVIQTAEQKRDEERRVQRRLQYLEDKDEQEMIFVAKMLLIAGVFYTAMWVYIVW